MSPAAIGPHGHGLIGVADRSETTKSKFAKRTWNVLWNQRNRKMGCGRRWLSVRSVRPFQDLTHSLPMGYLPKTRLRHARIACIILQSQDLSFKPSGIQGEFLKANTDAEEPGATIPRGAAGEEESGSLRIFIVDSHGSCAAGLCLLTRTLDTNPSLRSRAGFVPRLPPLGMTRREKGLSAAWRSGSTDYSSQVI